MKTYSNPNDLFNFAGFPQLATISVENVEALPDNTALYVMTTQRPASTVTKNANKIKFTYHSEGSLLLVLTYRLAYSPNSWTEFLRLEATGSSGNTVTCTLYEDESAVHHDTNARRAYVRLNGLTSGNYTIKVEYLGSGVFIQNLELHGLLRDIEGNTTEGLYSYYHNGFITDVGLYLATTDTGIGSATLADSTLKQTLLDDLQSEDGVQEFNFNLSEAVTN